jgi:hypothetical protein
LRASRAARTATLLCRVWHGSTPGAAQGGGASARRRWGK